MKSKIISSINLNEICFRLEGSTRKRLKCETQFDFNDDAELRWMPASAGRVAVSENYLLEYQWQHQKAYRGLSANGSKLCMISL